MLIVPSSGGVEILAPPVLYPPVFNRGQPRQNRSRGKSHCNKPFHLGTKTPPLPGSVYSNTPNRSAEHRSPSATKAFTVLAKKAQQYPLTAETQKFHLGITFRPSSQLLLYILIRTAAILEWTVSHYTSTAVVVGSTFFELTTKYLHEPALYYELYYITRVRVPSSSRLSMT